MNAMTEAFTSAGVKLPSQTERIWTHVKDSPRGAAGLTSKDVALATRIPIASVSSLMSSMANRGLLSAHKGRGVGGRKGIFYTAVGATYTPVPRPQQRTTNVPRPDVQVKAQYGLAPAVHSGVNIESMTVGEARALYNKLKELFGG